VSTDWSVQFANGVVADGGPWRISAEPGRIEALALDVMFEWQGAPPLGHHTGELAPPDGRATWAALRIAMARDGVTDWTIVSGGPPPGLPRGVREPDGVVS
jgi:hypothetical protein